MKCLDHYITFDELDSLFVDAIESGSQYWLGELPEIEKQSGDSEFYSERFWQAIKRGETLVVVDNEGSETGVINLKSVDNALDIIIKDYSRLWASIKSEDYDCDDADLFFQLCAFGDVIFG